jgi:hypothetical protein
MPRRYTPADGLIARAGRAHEDPKKMTEAANRGRRAKFTAEALRRNPDLSPEEAERAGALLLRAEMARLRKLRR